jgi:hypothetical protein
VSDIYPYYKIVILNPMQQSEWFELLPIKIFKMLY